MRIVYFYQYFGTAKGGWSTRVYEMTRRWVSQGHHVTVITSPYDKSDIPKGKGLSSKLHMDGIDVIVINVRQSNKVSTLSRITGFALYMMVAFYYAMKLKYDVAVCSSGPISVGPIGLMARWLRAKKFVFEVRDLWPSGAIELGVIKNPVAIKMARDLEMKCYKNAHLIVAASEGMRSDIVSRTTGSNIIVVPNACDNSLFEKKATVNTEVHHAVKPQRYFIYTGSLGRMDDCMQIMEGIKAFDAAKYPDVQFLIFGDGVDRQKMEAYAREHQLDNVVFKGLVPKQELSCWLHNAIASVITFRNLQSLQTVSPNKMFDAFAAGIPIVQTTIGWIRELVIKEGCGVNIAANQPEQMAAAFHAYLEKPEMAQQQGFNAKRLASTIFNRDYCARTMIDAIEKLVVSSNPPMHAALHS